MNSPSQQTAVTHPELQPIQNGVIEGQTLTKLDRAPKTPGSDGIDHLAARRASTRALEEEREACLTRAAEITAELGDEVEPQVNHPRPRRLLETGPLPYRAAPLRNRKPGRLKRRSPAQIAAAVDAIVSLLKKKPDGMRAEHIRDALDLDVREMPRVLREGLETKVLRCTGRKRATVYRAGK